jgi:hypothetical protein
MPAARRHRRKQKPPGRTRALELLAAAGAQGCPAGTLAAAGCAAADLHALVSEGFATANAVHLAGNNRAFDLSQLQITAAGREALAKATA